MEVMEREVHPADVWIDFSSDFERRIENCMLCAIQQKGWTTMEETTHTIADRQPYQVLVLSKLEQMLPEFLDKYCMEIRHTSDDVIAESLPAEIITFDPSWWDEIACIHCDDLVDVNDVTLDAWYEDDPYAQIYGTGYIEQINRLQNALLMDETGEGQFEIYSLEAGVGKSLNANRIIRDHIELFWEGKPRSFLIVKPFKEDVWATAKVIGEHDAWHHEVLGITSRNWADWKNKLDELEGFQVLVITHARYIQIVRGRRNKAILCAGATHSCHR